MHDIKTTIENVYYAIYLIND